MSKLLEKGMTVRRQNPSNGNSEIKKLKDHVLRLSTELKRLKEEQSLAGQISEEGHIFHNELIISRTNHALSRMLGYTQSEFIGKSLKRFVTEKSFRQLLEIKPESKVGSFELEMITRNGDLLRTLCKKIPLLKDGFTSEVLLVQNSLFFSDAQAAFKDIKEKNRVLSEATNVALLFLDNDTCIQANNAAYEMFGYERNELIGIFGIDIIADESKELVKQNMLIGYELPYEAIAVRKDGSTFIAEIEGKMYTYKGKQIRFYSIKDITHKKQTEQALIKSELLHRNITELVTDFVYEAKVLPGKKLYFEWGGEKFAELTGYSIDEIHSFERTWLSIVHPDDVLRIIAEIDNNDFTSDKRQIEYRIIKKGGDIAWLINKLIIEWDDKKNIVHILGAVHDITDRTTIETALKKSEERHRQISEMLSDYIYSFKIKPNQAPNTLWVSGSFEKICGYTLDEISDMKDGWLTIVHPDDVRALADDAVKDLTEKGKSDHVYRIRDKKGKLKWFQDRNMLVDYDATTKEITAIGATRDITEKKKAAQALKESEAKYKSLVENSPLGVGISKGEKMLFANKSFLDIYGAKSFKDFASKKITEYMPDDTKVIVRERIKKIENNLPLKNKFRHKIIRTDGEIRLVDENWSDIIYNGIRCRQIILNDVTLEKENEDALQRAANIFKNIQVGLFIYHLEELDDDRTLRLIAANPASSKIIGGTPNFKIGKTIDENFPNLRREKIPQQYAEVIRNKIPIELEDVYYGDENIENATFSVKVFPLPNQCVGVSFENVSARRIAENELRVRNNELNNFVYKVSHDLKAPLSSIKGLINLSKMEGNKFDHMDMIEDRINRLDGFIRDILSHSRNLNTAIIIEKLDLKDIVNYCFDDLDYLPLAKSIEKSVATRGVDFYNDKIRLAEICRNLVSNSIKYQDLNKKLMYVKVDMHITPKFATIIFEDNGIGIKKEYLKNIFKMFYRATESSEGSGIGLYIVKQAIEKLGGKINVKSKYGHGAKFTIKLPNLASKKES